MDKREVENKIKYKVGDIVLGPWTNVYKILKIGIETLYFDDFGAGVKHPTKNILYIAWADVEIIRKTPYSEGGTVTRMLGGDLWNDSYKKISLENGLKAYKTAKVLYGCKETII